MNTSYMKYIASFLLLLFFQNAEAQVSDTVIRDQGELLYNGIRLPAVWPPTDRDPNSHEVMEVPYLRNIPAVIPVNIGRQLFVDDFLIESSNLQRVFHQATKFEGNPVFQAETELELREYNDNSDVTYLGQGGLFYDPSAAHFKMFYTAGWRGALSMATSRDLIKWKRPELSIQGDNVLIPPGLLFAGGDNSVWLDLNAKDSTQRFKFITERWVDGDWKKQFDSRDDVPRHTVHTSADARIWSQGVNAGKANDYTSIFYNPFRNKWVFSLKHNSKIGRVRSYAEHDDFIKGATWKNMVPWVNADKLDLPDPAIGDSAQLYSLNAVAYESIILGEFYIHLGPHNKICEEGKFPKITELKLGFSRDGFHWDRPDRTPFIAPTRKEGDWDRAYLHGTTGICVVVGDEIWFPYCGYSGVADDGHSGMYTGASIGMARLRRDGFASMEAGNKAGTLTTRPIIFDKGQYLFVNVDCPEGSLTVEVLDQDGKVMKGFQSAKCTPISVNSTIQMISWKDHNSLEPFQNKPIKLRFTMKNGKLYSFWISPEMNGASLGYLAAGSPGQDGVVDTKGLEAYSKK